MKIKVAVIGVGNCASSLIQGLEYYRDQKPGKEIVGLMHNAIGRYKISDIEIVAAFEALPSKIKEIKGFKWGTNNSPEKLDKGLTHAFVLTFANEKDRDTYLPHPGHKEFGKLVGGWLADVTVVDFTNQAK